MREIKCRDIQIGDKIKIPREAHVDPMGAMLDKEYWVVIASFVSDSGDFMTVVGSSFQLELLHDKDCVLLDQRI